MKGNYFLSEILGVERLKANILNMVEAPCGSGKSEWAFNVVAPVVKDKHRIIYLIDTVNGREQFLRRGDTRHYSREWYNEVESKMINWNPEPNKIVVMTYTLFGILSKRSRDFGYSFNYIICDEMHNLIRFQYFGDTPEASFNRIAQNRLEDICAYGAGKIIGITATPDRVKRNFGAEIEDVLTPIERESLKTYRTVKIQGYTNINEIIKEMAVSGGKGICYIAHVRQMKQIYILATEIGLRVGMFWSLENKDHPMIPEQLALRDYILDNQQLPPDIDLLIINASSETAINIRGQIDYMIIHHKNEDTRTQVRGRYRDDLTVLYVHDNDAQLFVPDRFMGRYLLNEEREELCNVFNKVNANGRMYKWPTIHETLLNSGYTIMEKRIKNRRAYMILYTE